jgi:hypothetical protein
VVNGLGGREVGKVDAGGSIVVPCDRGGSIVSG